MRKTNLKSKKGKSSDNESVVDDANENGEEDTIASRGSISGEEEDKPGLKKKRARKSGPVQGKEDDAVVKEVKVSMRTGAGSMLTCFQTASWSCVGPLSLAPEKARLHYKTREVTEVRKDKSNGNSTIAEKKQVSSKKGSSLLSKRGKASKETEVKEIPQDEEYEQSTWKNMSPGQLVAALLCCINYLVLGGRSVSM
uniref:Uncharacterized protein n=1 Tax=Timema poppense TaxID=170557 RepID=A0A7R9D9W7_TIMPO|nr:unnamed protein product [Timema poppensis]